MLDRVLALGGAGHLQELALDQIARDIRVEAHHVRPQCGGQPGGAGQQPVAARHREAFAPAGVGAGHPVAQGRAVHDVVVVERGDVDELGDHGGVDDPVPPLLPELRPQQHQQRTHPLAARHGEMARQLAHPGIGRVRRDVHQTLLDGLHALRRPVPEQRVPCGDTVQEFTSGRCRDQHVLVLFPAGPWPVHSRHVRRRRQRFENRVRPSGPAISLTSSCQPVPGARARRCGGCARQVAATSRRKRGGRKRSVPRIGRSRPGHGPGSRRSGRTRGFRPGPAAPPSAPCATPSDSNLPMSEQPAPPDRTDRIERRRRNRCAPRSPREERARRVRRPGGPAARSPCRGVALWSRCQHPGHRLHRSGHP